jgi:hypothetical protein
MIIDVGAEIVAVVHKIATAADNRDDLRLGKITVKLVRWKNNIIIRGDLCIYDIKTSLQLFW